ncbi:MAG TPA: antibiotic biosynthesis monooxygenase [Mycobacteriales bacterium]|jgi:quinol monooxygenase YgiN|nr:antibiotic biosynthesis monooxygenase [Mycobacteriales bacterium]
MVSVGLLIRLHAKPGSEETVAQLLASAVDTVNKEEGTIAWFALRFDSTHFGVFDAFPDDEARNAHLTANLSAVEGIADLLVAAPTIESADVLTAKLPN